jgi:hypothetical protein
VYCIESSASDGDNSSDDDDCRDPWLLRPHRRRTSYHHHIHPTLMFAPLPTVPIPGQPSAGENVQTVDPSQLPQPTLLDDVIRQNRREERRYFTS